MEATNTWRIAALFLGGCAMADGPDTGSDSGFIDASGVFDANLLPRDASVVDALPADADSGPFDVTVIVESGLAPSQNYGGGDWDCCLGLNTPDLYVAASIAGIVYKTVNQSNLPTVWNQEIADGISSDDLAAFKLEMLDSDEDADDTLGACEFSVDPEQLDGRSHTFDCPRNDIAETVGFSVTMKFDPEN